MKRPLGWDRLRHYQQEAALALARRERVGLWVGAGLGKALANGSRVLTPDRGFVPIELLVIGDEICDPDGGITRVTGVFPQGVKEIHRVTTKDGAAVCCTTDHLWHVQTRYDVKVGKDRVVPLSYIIERGTRTEPNSKGWTRHRFSLPLAQPVEFTYAGNLPIAPYLLGVLLGDGALNRGASVTNPDNEILERCRVLVPDGTQINVYAGLGHRCDNWAVVGIAYENPCRTALAKLGLLGKLSIEKHIPTDYMGASYEDRLELLRGLMDTDGDCTPDGVSIFSTSSPTLAEHVRWIVRSLGGMASRYTKEEPTYTYKGETRVGQPAYRVNVRLAVNPFHLTRKAERWKPSKLWQAIDTVEPAGEAECTCISTDAKRGLFITDDFIVTHNTSTILAALHLADVPPPWLFVTRAIGRHAFPRDALWVLGPDHVPGVLWAGSPRSNDGYHRNGTYSDLELLLSERPGCVTNYEILGKRLNELNEVDWRCVILDEAHAIKGGYQRVQKKGDGTVHLTRYHHTRLIVQNVRARGGPIWEMTATPIRNRRIDLWAQLDLALPGRFGPAVSWVEANDRCEHRLANSFGRRFCDAHIDEWGAINLEGVSMTGELNERCRKHFVLITREEVAAELPKMQREVRVVPVDASSRKYLGGGVEEALARAAHAKIPPALEIMSEYLEGGGKVLLAVNRKKLCGEVAYEVMQYLASKKVSPKVRRECSVESVNGDMAVIPRVEALTKFNQQPGIGVMVATMDSMRESVDLHYVDAAIVIMLPYSPGDVEQFEGRFARLGGKPCLVIYLVAEETVDERVRELLLDKLGDVIDVGTDTAGCATAHNDLKNCYNEEQVLADLRSWLGESGEE